MPQPFGRRYPEHNEEVDARCEAADWRSEDEKLTDQSTA